MNELRFHELQGVTVVPVVPHDPEREPLIWSNLSETAAVRDGLEAEDVERVLWERLLKLSEWMRWRALLDGEIVVDEQREVLFKSRTRPTSAVPWNSPHSVPLRDLTSWADSIGAEVPQAWMSSETLGHTGLSSEDLANETGIVIRVHDGGYMHTPGEQRRFVDEGRVVVVDHANHPLEMQEQLVQRRCFMRDGVEMVEVTLRRGLVAVEEADTLFVAATAVVDL